MYIELHSPGDNWQYAMRCFFHLVGPEGASIPDAGGVEVASLEEARTEAMKGIAELRREEPALQQDWNGWTLWIVDESGELLSKIQLNAVSHPIAGPLGVPKGKHHGLSGPLKRKQHLFDVFSYSPTAIHWASLAAAVAQFST